MTERDLYKYNYTRITHYESRSVTTIIIQTIFIQKQSITSLNEINKGAEIYSRYPNERKLGFLSKFIISVIVCLAILVPLWYLIPVTSDISKNLMWGISIGVLVGTLKWGTVPSFDNFISAVILPCLGGMFAGGMGLLGSLIGFGLMGDWAAIVGAVIVSILYANNIFLSAILKLPLLIFTRIIALAFRGTVVALTGSFLYHSANIQLNVFTFWIVPFLIGAFAYTISLWIIIAFFSNFSFKEKLKYLTKGIIIDSVDCLLIGLFGASIINSLGLELSYYPLYTIIGLTGGASLAIISMEGTLYQLRQTNPAY